MGHHDVDALRGPDEPRLEGSPPQVLGGLVQLAHAAFRREPGLVGLGLAGLAVAGLCFAAVAVRGPFVPPEGKMLGAAVFSAGVGLFVLTLALLLPLAGFSEAARRRWRRLSYSFFVFGFVLEPLQAWRGIDPRFTEVGDAIDVVLGLAFGVTAALFVVLMVIFGLRFFRAGVLEDRPLLCVGIRYGVIAVWISFGGAGILMSLLGGRIIGGDGNLLPSHALGVHGIQTLPLAALLLAWAGVGSRSRTWLHVVGIGWLVASTAALAQALLGRPPFDPSLLALLTVVGPVMWVVAVGAALAATWRRLVPTADLGPPVTGSERTEPQPG